MLIKEINLYVSGPLRTRFTMCLAHPLKSLVHVFVYVSRSMFVAMHTLQGEGQRALPRGPTHEYCCKARQ